VLFEGFPDLGLLGMSEMVETAVVIAGLRHGRHDDTLPVGDAPKITPSRFSIVTRPQ
jgi:hypothetical protein